ncbi:class I SAM-dependent methyltransferase [Shewanella intestini]|uniref:Class I SAM-dependent methyltransferase n=2 Tax=Shewanellaceae TaxID=267890 RepID=A0ABS5I1H4_9GAMM|nr:MULTISPECIES: methyltransferase domain-containing protein [Shewanella]MBR9727868.1 class I SAM-dependent methyltransferase [Shewanella intestini]MRG36139.1 methyltransferase domain-containing protein [Shewanella sp. XMDDZSB0408]
MIKNAIERQLKPWWPRVFGYHLLKLGALSAQVSSLHCSVSRHYSMFDSNCDNHLPDAHADLHHLPVNTKSIDSLLSVFNLEYETDPYQVLREMDRVLISGGYLFLIGFNPVSPLFLGKLLPKCQTQLPWCGQFFMPSRIKDWLGLLGYQIQSDERFMFDSLLTKRPNMLRMQDKLQHWLPNVGGVYLIVAKKVDIPLSRIRQNQEQKTTPWATAPSAGRNVNYEQLNKHDRKTID